MLLWVGKIALLSLMLIFLMHYLYSFFLQNLTTPKVKDLVNRPSEQYEGIMRSLKAEAPPPAAPREADQGSQGSRMKDELKSFLAQEMGSKRVMPGGDGGGGALGFSTFA